MSFDAFFASASLVTIAEIGDKTQLLALMLAARFGKPLPIISGIFLATLLNHALAAYAGHYIGAQFMQSPWFGVCLGVLFLAMGVWALIPDTMAEQTENSEHNTGAFIATFVCFFAAEMGDKTQLATIALGANYSATLWVILGTTLGMMLANVPAVLFGDALLRKISLRYVRACAASVFVAFGVLEIARAWKGITL